MPKTIPKFIKFSIDYSFKNTLPAWQLAHPDDKNCL